MEGGEAGQWREGKGEKMGSSAIMSIIKKLKQRKKKNFPQIVGILGSSQVISVQETLYNFPTNEI